MCGGTNQTFGSIPFNGIPHTSASSHAYPRGGQLVLQCYQHNKRVGI